MAPALVIYELGGLGNAVIGGDADEGLAFPEEQVAEAPAIAKSFADMFDTPAAYDE